ncbi:MAG: heterodisulfide reductase-related iron-sulfur binding cluster, partial [Candidatus Limnocylindria bacterium]
MSGRQAEGPDKAQSFDISSFLLRTTDGSTWDVSDAEKFDFAGFFDWMVDCRHLLLAKDELTWMQTQRVVDERRAIFLNMSCGTQLAPHLTLDTVSVFRALGIDFVAGSGRQYCCGKIYRSRGRMSAGESVSHASLDRITEWGAETAVHTCHSCQIMYTDYTTRVADAAPGLANTHVSQFIEARLRELGDRVPWRKTLDLRVLVEGHGPEVSPVHHAATEAETRLLALIPGVTVVGLVDAPARGMPCKS